jgi:hypothetical protein
MNKREIERDRGRQMEIERDRGVEGVNDAR